MAGLVILNKWDGQQFESPIRCNRCSQTGTVRKVTINGITFLICKGCLLGFISDIDHAILESAVKSAESTDIARAVFEFKKNQRNQEPADFVIKEITRS